MREYAVLWHTPALAKPALGAHYRCGMLEDAKSLAAGAGCDAYLLEIP